MWLEIFSRFVSTALKCCSWRFVMSIKWSSFFSLAKILFSSFEIWIALYVGWGQQLWCQRWQGWTVFWFWWPCCVVEGHQGCQWNHEFCLIGMSSWPRQFVSFVSWKVWARCRCICHIGHIFCQVYPEGQWNWRVPRCGCNVWMLHIFQRAWSAAEVFGVLQFWCLIWNCSNLIHFEDQKFQEEEEDGHGEEGVVAGAGYFGEKAPGASFVTAALADFLMNFCITLHFSFKSWGACWISCPRWSAL